MTISSGNNTAYVSICYAIVFVLAMLMYHTSNISENCSSKIEVAYQEAIALRRQEELIREEEEAWLAETEQRAKRGAAEREKKSKKKQV